MRTMSHNQTSNRSEATIVVFRAYELTALVIAKVKSTDYKTVHELQKFGSRNSGYPAWGC